MNFASSRITRSWARPRPHDHGQRQRRAPQL